jgi:hypothetical protein
VIAENPLRAAEVVSIDEDTVDFENIKVEEVFPDQKNGVIYNDNGNY